MNKLTKKDIIKLAEEIVREIIEEQTEDKELRYLVTMVPTMEKFEDIDKLNRWLGFMQGVLYSKAWYCVWDLGYEDELRKRNEAKMEGIRGYRPKLLILDDRNSYE